MKEKGAHVVISSQTAANPYDSEGVWVNRTPPQFVSWSRNAALSVEVDFIDHYSEMLKEWRRHNGKEVDTYFTGPVHTYPSGAMIQAEVFARNLEPMLPDYPKLLRKRQ